MSQRGFRALGFDDVEEVPWKPGLALRPLRSLLGLRAFGTAGFVGRDSDEARRWLEEAIARVPELRREAQDDPLLAAL